MDAQETYKLQARKAEATEAAQQEVIARLRVELAVQEVSNAGALEAAEARHGAVLVAMRTSGVKVLSPATSGFLHYV